MKIEVIEIKPVDPPKEYILKVNQNELDLISACLGKVAGYDGPQGWREILNKFYYKVYEHSTKNRQDKILNQNGQFPSDKNRVVPEV